MAQVVKAVANAANDSRPKLLALLTATGVTGIVVEQRDRRSGFGVPYLESLRQAQGRTREVVHQAENDHEDLIADLVAIVSSLTARLYGQQRAKRTTERIAAQLCAERAERAERAEQAERAEEGDATR